MSNSRDITEYENSSPQRLIWFVAIAGIGCLTAIPFRRSVPPSADMGEANSAQTSTPFARVSDIRGGAIADDAYLPPSVPFAGQAAPETVDSILVDVPQPLHPGERFLPQPFPRLTNLSSNPKGLNPPSFKRRKNKPHRFFPNAYKTSRRVSPGRFKIIEGPSRRVIKR